MTQYSWGVDILGRCHICKEGESKIILSCLVSPALCVLDLEAQDAREYANNHGVVKALKISWMRKALLNTLIIKTFERLENLKTRKSPQFKEAA